MEMESIKKLTSEKFGVQFNEITIEALFKEYEAIGFVYPAKKALLQPHFEAITNNWKQLLKSEDLLLWVLTKCDQQKTDSFASVSLWKQSNYGMIAQHLVSTGNPYLSLQVMLAAQYCVMHSSNEQEIRSGQNWFRPDNRYAYRVFASMYDKLGPEKAALRSYAYLHLPLGNIQGASLSNPYRLEEVGGYDAELTTFVIQQYGKVFLKAEELDEEDIQLKRLGGQFGKLQLSRSRRVYKMRYTQNGKIVGAIVANRAPIGMNFSFLENRAYYIFDKALSLEKRLKAIKAANAEMRPCYSDFALGCVPIITDEVTSDLLLHFGAKFQRTYMQSIWLREGCPQWYAHIQSFLQKIESRSIPA